MSHWSNSALARALGIHSRTVTRWKSRQDVADRSTRPHRINTKLSPWEETLIVELRRTPALPLDDIVEAMRRCINPACRAAPSIAVCSGTRSRPA